MATATLIPVTEYLNTTYRPDRDYIDGELRERTLGERPHSLLQMALGVIFHANRILWQVVPLPEQRVQVSATRFRIPDLSILRRSDPADPIVHTAPLLCIEILSRDDSLSDMQERVDDYTAMGVDHIWAVDPLRRVAYLASPAGFQRVEEELTVPGTPIRIILSELFHHLDDIESPG